MAVSSSNARFPLVPSCASPPVAPSSAHWALIFAMGCFFPPPRARPIPNDAATLLVSFQSNWQSPHIFHSTFHPVAMSLGEPENLFADSRTQVDAWTADDNVIRVDADDDALLADDADVDGGDAEAAVSEMHHDEVAVYYGDDNGVKAGLPGK
eukprot:CAMPEP_0201931146 /NCGR_PEP_ID=MMETSP0903-20130614/26732_1 /ASSEMBLY_ACC=CAM_ASM_000552 /TAXON_ID=420261 /ORGANISM="Thalassiosira antarctica, Strain CCMP982" /LENGTH=152 /DNA_ID=CAMNT_0048470401 /DNA_START=221 /DNA_END=680 /DNA_ORIENTATION=+